MIHASRFALNVCGSTHVVNAISQEVEIKVLLLFGAFEKLLKV